METGSIRAASTTTQSCAKRDFLAFAEYPRFCARGSPARLQPWRPSRRWLRWSERTPMLFRMHPVSWAGHSPGRASLEQCVPECCDCVFVTCQGGDPSFRGAAPELTLYLDTGSIRFLHRHCMYKRHLSATVLECATVAGVSHQHGPHRGRLP